MLAVTVLSSLSVPLKVITCQPLLSEGNTRDGLFPRGPLRLEVHCRLVERAQNQRMLERLRRKLGEAAFEAGWKAGSALTLEQAIELAQERFPIDS